MSRLEILNEQIQKYMDKHQDRSYYIEYLRTKKYGYQKIESSFRGDNVLELGSDGAATSSILVRWSKKLTIIDIHDHITALSKEDEIIKKATFIQSRWEDFQPKELFSDILLTDSLEHVDHPIDILMLVSNWLEKDGRLHIIVPNALSLHRLIGMQMGYLKTPYDFNDNDISSLHKRVYDRDMLRHDIESSHLIVEKIEGIQFKPMTDSQLAMFIEPYKEALNALSYLFDNHCAEIYACCKKVSHDTKR